MPINLLPQKTFEESAFWEKLLRWSFGVGRLVIIGTEIVVLSAFFARFFIDRRITDLSEKIKTQQTIISTTGNLEERFRLLQDRLIAIKNLKENQNNYSATLMDLTQRIPPTTRFTTLALERGRIELLAETPSGGEFAKLLTQLFTWKALYRVVLKSANFSTTKNAYQFTLELRIKPNAYLAATK